MVHRVGTFDLLKGKVLTNLFYEPSTRTSSSFVAAIERLGGSVIQINNVTFSSVSKGESLADTVRTMEQYTDAIVLRHPEQGSAAEAAAATTKPIINAGDGAGEHPTQALLDAHTIREEMGGIDGLTITMVGDLKYGRTVHSLAKLLTMFDVKINYVSPEILRMPELLVKEVDAAGIDQIETTDLESVLPDTDVLYVTRIQKERFSDPAEYDQVKGSYVISPETMAGAKARRWHSCTRCPGWGRSRPTSTPTPGPPTSVRWSTACTPGWRCWPWCSGRPKRGRAGVGGRLPVTTSSLPVSRYPFPGLGSRTPAAVGPQKWPATGSQWGRRSGS